MRRAGYLFLYGLALGMNLNHLTQWAVSRLYLHDERKHA